MDDRNEIPEMGPCECCGYDLRGLDRFRCPECGTPFLPGLMPKHKTISWQLFWARGFLVYVFAIVLISTGVVIFCDIDGDIGGNTGTGFLILLVLYFLLGLPPFLILMMFGSILWYSTGNRRAESGSVVIANCFLLILGLTIAAAICNDVLVTMLFAVGSVAAFIAAVIVSINA